MEKAKVQITTRFLKQRFRFSKCEFGYTWEMDFPGQNVSYLSVCSIKADATLMESVRSAIEFSSILKLGKVSFWAGSNIETLKNCTEAQFFEVVDLIGGKG